MRKLFQQLTDELKSFLDQAEDLLLLLACGVDDTALVLKTIRDLEQADASDIFLLHADDFVGLDPFVTAALERLAADHQRTSAALVDSQREPRRCRTPCRTGLGLPWRAYRKRWASPAPSCRAQMGIGSSGSCFRPKSPTSRCICS